MEVIFKPNHMIWQRLQRVHILSLIMHFHTLNVYFDDVLTFHASIFLTKKQIISIQTQHPQLGFTFITPLRVVLIMVEFHWKTIKYVTCVNNNLYQTNLQNIYTRKELVIIETKNSIFYTSFCIPAIQTLEFHLPHVHILGTNNCGEMQRTAFKRHGLFQDLLCSRDYAERLVASFDHQIQSYYYSGNISVSI